MSNMNLQHHFAANWKASSENCKTPSEDAEGFLQRALRFVHTQVSEMFCSFAYRYSGALFTSLITNFICSGNATE